MLSHPVPDPVSTSKPHSGALGHSVIGTAVAHQGPGIRIYHARYDAVGNLMSTVYPNGVSAVPRLDNMNRVTNLAISSGGSSLASYAYTYGPASNKLSATESNGRSTAFNYDAVYRLTQEATTGDPNSKNGTLAYSLDPVGNRLALNSTLTGISSVTESYDPDDRLTVDTYDANGNTLASGGNTYAYDFENRLISVNNGAVTMVYDGDDNRVAKGSTQYLVDSLNPTGLPQVVEEISGGAVRRSYAYGLQRISQERVVSGPIVPSFYSYDGHGDVRLLTDPTGTVTDTYEYDSYGNAVGSTGSTPNVYQYQGEQLDSETGFYYLRARYYNAGTGRFLSVDPAMGADDNPGSAHPYLYAGADPVDGDDPTGEIEGAILGQLISGNASTFTSSVSLSNNFGGGTFNPTGALVACVLSRAGSLINAAGGGFNWGGCVLNVTFNEAPGGSGSGGGGGGGGGGNGNGGPPKKSCSDCLQFPDSNETEKQVIYRMLTENSAAYVGRPAYGLEDTSTKMKSATGPIITWDSVEVEDGYFYSVNE